MNLITTMAIVLLPLIILILGLWQTFDRKKGKKWTYSGLAISVLLIFFVTVPFAIELNTIENMQRVQPACKQFGLEPGIEQLAIASDFLENIPCMKKTNDYWESFCIKNEKLFKGDCWQ